MKIVIVTICIVVFLVGNVQARGPKWQQLPSNAPKAAAEHMSCYFTPTLFKNIEKYMTQKYFQYESDSSWGVNEKGFIKTYWVKNSYHIGENGIWVEVYWNGDYAFTTTFGVLQEGSSQKFLH